MAKLPNFDELARQVASAALDFEYMGKPMREWIHMLAEHVAITDPEEATEKKPERLTIRSWRNLDPWETCGQDNYCNRCAGEQGGCERGCIVPKIYAKLAKIEDEQEGAKE